MGGFCDSCVGLDENDKNTEIRPSKAPWTNNKKSSIVIIGAGPSGVHMGSLLKKAGFENIQILEKRDRIGGKSWSINDSVYHNPQEMGTCFTSSLGGFFDEIYKLFDEYDDDNEMIDLPDTNKLIIEENGALQGYDDYLYENIEKEAVPKWLHFLPDKLSSAIPFISAANRYCNIHGDIFGEDYEYSALPKPKTDEKLQLMNMTLLEFLKQNELEAMIPMYLFLYTMFGYGPMDGICAYYGLWWFKPSLVKAVIDICNLIDKKPTAKITKKGFQSLWINIVEKCNLNIKYNVNIIGVNRNITKNGRIIIKYNEEKEESECLCDALFIACDMKDSLHFLDATEEEMKIFSSIEHYTLSTSLIEFERNDKIFTEYKADNLCPSNLWSTNGNIVEFRMTQKVLNKKEYESSKGKDNCDRAIVKQFLNEETNDDTYTLLKDKMYSNLKQMIGIDIHTVKEIEPLNIWQYFPHYSSEAIQKGYPWIVRDEMQGKYNNTYYIGSSVCFESVKDVVEYNIQLQQKINF